MTRLALLGSVQRMDCATNNIAMHASSREGTHLDVLHKDVALDPADLPVLSLGQFAPAANSDGVKVQNCSSAQTPNVHEDTRRSLHDVKQLSPNT